MDTDMVKSIKHIRTRVHSKLSKHSVEAEELKDSPRKNKPREKTKKELATEMEYVKKNGTARIKLKMKILFTGCSFIVSRLESTVPAVEDFLVSVNVQNSLMSDQQLSDLNPISIKLEKICEMPDDPISYTELREKCYPTYCAYSLFNHPTHQTEGLLQEKNIYLNDTNVYLAGLIERQQLLEFLHSTPFEIEVHDRNRKPVQRVAQKACLFGNDPVDDSISKVNSVASKHTIHNPFETRSKFWDPFGVAKLDLHEIALGKKLLEFYVPVLPCAAPDVLGKNSNKKSSNTKQIGNEDTPMQAGAFLESNTYLYAKITLAKPLFQNKTHRPQMISNNEPKVNIKYKSTIFILF